MPVPERDPLVVAPLPTPFDSDDRVDFRAIERNIGRWLETPLSGFVLNTENGEEAFLSEAERLEIVRTVHQAHNGRRFILAGIDCPSVRETLRQAELFAEAGADLLRLRIPRLTSNIRGYFEQVVPRSPVPVVMIHQTAPGQFLSGPSVAGAAPELIGELTALDNVWGYITYDNIRFESRVRQYVPAHKRFWISNGSLLLPGAAIGANGACLMLGNVLPEACLQILRTMQEGDLATAQAIQRRVLDADWQILSRGAAGIKTALNLLGFELGAPRAPALACDAAAVEQIRQALMQAGALS